MADFLLALDQGTTSSRAIVFDRAGAPVASDQREFRQVIRVTKEPSGELRVVLYSIDQNGQGAPGTMTIQGSTVRMAGPSINVTY